MATDDQRDLMIQAHRIVIRLLLKTDRAHALEVLEETLPQLTDGVTEEVQRILEA